MNINIYLLIFINILLTLGGFLITVVGNYITENYTLQHIDSKINQLVQNQKPKICYISDKLKQANIIQK